MIDQFSPITDGILTLVKEWEARLSALPEDMITQRKNSQDRSIRQILGHLVDSASNNTHRIVHLQYQPGPLRFPNYATDGNNDRWIAIQDYQHEDWHTLISLWKYSNLHLVHVINSVDTAKLELQWQSSDKELITLQEMISDYLPHLELHLAEIKEMID